MGAWGSGHFENDEAMDWVWTLEDDTDGSTLRAVLDPVAKHRPTGQPPEVEASLALAAAAVVAKARGTSDDVVPREAEAWLAAHSESVDEDLRELAIKAVARVLAAIEGEPGSEDWTAEVQRLAKQLTL